MTTRRPKPKPRRAAKTQGFRSSDSVLTGLMRAIAHQRLPPGTKLNEETLGEIFGVSRTKVREALLRLQARGLVSAGTKRTARIATPSIKEVRDMFSARRLVEPEIAARAAQTATAELLQALRRLHRDEHRARETGDRVEATRLSGEFHVVLARHGGNNVLIDIVQSIIDRTFLVILLYQAPHTPPCVNAEHETIIGAIEAGDARTAAQGMLDHIKGIESRMLLVEQPSTPLDLKSAFAGLAR